MIVWYVSVISKLSGALVILASIVDVGDKQGWTNEATSNINLV